MKEIYGYDPGDDVFVVSTKLGITASMQLDELCCRLRPGDVPAVIGGNSVTTVQAYKAIHSRGLSMPEEIGLCGPEDWNWQQEMSWATLVEPNITTSARMPPVCSWRTSKRRTPSQRSSCSAAG